MSNLELDLTEASPRAEFLALRAVDMLHSALSAIPLSVDPDHGIASRIKSGAATRRKIEEKGIASDVVGVVNDFIGIRIVAQHLEMLDGIDGVLREWSDELGLVLSQKVDLFSSPGSAGYRAIHYDYRLAHPEEWSLPTGAGIEVQLTTWLQRLHSQLSHSLYYRAEAERAEAVRAALESMAAELHEVDRRVSQLLASTTTLGRKSRDIGCVG